MAQPVWNTPAGSVGTFASLLPLEYTFSASAVLPAVSITYTLLSGSIPSGLTFTDEGILIGTPSLVTSDTVYTFAIRATDNFNNIKDRTFSITVSGSAIPSFTTSEGSLLSTQDSIWIEIPIGYDNPDINNPVTIGIKEGLLPPGLEINPAGIIRGYADPPIASITLSSITTAATATSSATNQITCLSTTNFLIGRPIVFTGTTIGGITAGVTYYVKTIVNSTTFTISSTINGTTALLTDDVGFMDVTLPATSIGQPTIRTYNFTLKLESPLGGDIAAYSITVINQNTPTSQGGPGFPPNTRKPVILNTQPLYFDVNRDTVYNGYYIVPDPLSNELTIPPSRPAFIGTTQSDNYFAFKIIGKDFDNNKLIYSFSGLPLGLNGDTETGWITGTPILGTQGINRYQFEVLVYKEINPTIVSQNFNFSFTVSNDINGTIVWITPDDLGTIFNGTVSTLSVEAEADVALNYRLISGTLPPNLTILENGEITGYVANQSTEEFLIAGDTTEFTFTIQAYSPIYPIIESDKTFTVTVLQEFSQPTDVLYIKATPSIADRIYIDSLLDNNNIIPTQYLYRPTDQYFGKATNVVYEHAYGIYASDITEYLNAVTRNHYWRNITLGELKTAVAKNENGEIIYEVVYSEVIDNLVNPQGVSISSSIFWPRFINLNQGPWYTSITDIYTSFVFASTDGQELEAENTFLLLTEDSQYLETEEGQPTFYTSLTPGFARTLYPNSLYNMRNRVGEVLGQEFDSRLLPLWMTSQQANGSTLGYTQAWVICYTLPGFAETIKNNINTLWVDELGRQKRLNRINFQIDRFSVNKSITYNYDNNVIPPAWTGLPSATPVPDPLDSKDFYVLFPQETILPNESQY